MELVCEHLREALSRRSRIPTFFRYPLGISLSPDEEEIMAELCFCLECVERRELPVPARTLSEAEHEGQYRGRLETKPVCAACFARQLAATPEPSTA